MSVPPEAIAPNPHTNLLNVYIQIAKKMGFQKKIFLYKRIQERLMTFYFRRVILKVLLRI
jgi:hypothetical protein